MPPHNIKLSPMSVINYIIRRYFWYTTLLGQELPGMPPMMCCDIPSIVTRNFQDCTPISNCEFRDQIHYGFAVHYHVLFMFCTVNFKQLQYTFIFDSKIIWNAFIWCNYHDFQFLLDPITVFFFTSKIGTLNIKLGLQEQIPNFLSRP